MEEAGEEKERPFPYADKRRHYSWLPMKDQIDRELESEDSPGNWCAHLCNSQKGCLKSLQMHI